MNLIDIIKRHEELRATFPFTLRKVLILESIGGIIGTVIGIFFRHGFIGAVIGIVVGILFAIIFKNKISMQSLRSIQNRLHLIFAIGSFIFAAVGVLAFIDTGDTDFIVGILFFGIGGTFLIIRRRKW